MGDERLTERLLVRPPRPLDQDAYRALFLDPAVTEWLRPAPLDPIVDSEVAGMLGDDQAHWVEHGFGPWVLVERAGGMTVGRGGLRRTQVDGVCTVELPWTIGTAHWGRGFATEAAKAAIEWARSLGLDEVVALIMGGNGRSRKVAEKAGLELAGRTRHAGLPHLVYRLQLAQAPGRPGPP